jgi:hypothetical protein
VKLGFSYAAVGRPALEAPVPVKYVST